MRCAHFIAAIGLLFQAGHAGAICPINPPHYRVGDMASDAACQYDSIQAAIDAAGTCPVVIDVTREHQYTGGYCTPGQTTANGCHLAVSGKNITLQGWPDSVTCYSLSQSVCQTCGPNRTDSLVTLDANNNGTLLTATGTSNVTLRNMTLSHGNAGALNGGGIRFSGSGSLNLYATTVNLNQAANGAGIEFNGSGGNATLTLGANTQILANTAGGSGGGIRIEGSARLFALQAQTQISFNHAPNGYGGGVQALGPAQVDIGSPGYGSGGVIFYNDAQYGGGIAAAATNDTSPVRVRLFSVDAHQPVRISQNTASRSGGGVWLKPSGAGAAGLCAMDFRLDGNIAQEGAAIYGDTDFGTATYGSTIDLITAPDAARCATPENVTSLGAVRCAPGAACNTIDGNLAQDSGTNPTPGAMLLVQNQGSLYSTALALRGNAGAHAVRVFDSAVTFVNCLVADNAFGASAFLFENQGGIIGGPGTENLGNCTIANNSLASGAVIASDHGLTLMNSLIAQPGVASLDYGGNANDLAVAYVVSNSISTLPGGNDVMQGTPSFVDPANGDYHLTPTSLGIDYAPAAGGTDLDGNPRDWDLPAIGNVHGPRDLGAYERQNLFNNCGANDSFFCDGFESNR